MDNTLRYPFKDDHEFLIALIADFNNSMANVNRQIAADHTTTLEVRQLLLEQNANLEKRLRAVEEELVHLNPKEIADTIQWRKDFNKWKHLAWIAGSGFFIALGYFLQAVYYFVHTFLHIG